jgi:RNA polymerase sigma-70 factor, ECF subfamily
MISAPAPVRRAGQLTDADADPDAVVAAAISGDDRALSELFRACQPRLVRYLRGQAPAVADDLAGEVWIAVAIGLPTFVGDANGFRSWLFTIARRRVIEHRRRVLRRRTDPVPADRFDARPAIGRAADPAGFVVERLCAQDAVDMLVARLSPHQAQVVLLRVLDDLDVFEVAEIMERTPASVRVLQHRALKRLAERILSTVAAE